MNRLQAQVLVVGSGPAGATAALLLAREGIDVLLVSRSRWLADSPRAHITNLRTMEIMRDAGLEAACVARAVPQALMSNRVWATSMAGPELARLRAWGTHPSRSGEYEAASPCRMCDLPQDVFEPILLDEAARRGARVRFAHELIDFEQDAEGVTAVVLDRELDQRLEVRADYLVGADGGRSRVVERLGLPLRGTPALAPAFHVIVEADLSRHVAHRPGSLYTIYQSGLESWGGAGTFRMVRPWDEWAVSFSALEPGSDLQLHKDDIVPRLRRMIGDPDIDLRIKQVGRWHVNQVVAERYSQGRVFCAGDAVHRHPPKNGLGSNTAIQDAFNLAWKLAYVVKGWAAPALLASYSDERQPVGATVVERSNKSLGDDRLMQQAIGFHPGQSAQARDAALAQLTGDSAEGRARRAALAELVRRKNYTVNALGIELNHHYRSAAVVDDGIAEPAFTLDAELHYHPTARPGARLPHCWLERRRQRLSSLDLCGQGRFTLFTSDASGRWQQAARALGTRRGLPLAVCEIGPGFAVQDVYGDWAALRGVEEDGCVLVRPDQHVAWRSRGLPADPGAALDAVIAEVLGEVLGEVPEA